MKRLILTAALVALQALPAAAKDVPGFTRGLGTGDAAADGELRFMCFNIWGPYFGNPVWERDLKEAAYVKRVSPDLVGFQEVVPEFWNSRLFRELSSDYGVVRREGTPNAEFNPILWKKSRFALVEGGTHVYAAADNPEGSKGFGWGVFRDRATGKTVIAYSTHLMWSCPKYPRERTALMRVHNARELLAKLAELRARHPGAAIVGGGDLNTSVAEGEAGCVTPFADFKAFGLADAQETVKGASPWSSDHGDPRRDALGNLRAFFRRGSDNPKNSIDHVHYLASAVEPLALLVDRSQDALECSDHSPVILTFRLR